jgi:hypothetical protein
MKQTLTTTVLALGLGFFSIPSFASGYIVNGRRWACKSQAGPFSLRQPWTAAPPYVSRPRSYRLAMWEQLRECGSGP